MEGNMQDEKNPEQKPRPVDDADVKAPTGAGMKIAVTVIIVAVIGGLLAAAYFLFLVPEQKRKAELAVHENFLSEYTGIKASGYDDFWRCVFPLATEEQANSNLKLESIIKNAIGQNEEGFGKHIVECLPILKKHVDAAKTLEAPPDYASGVKELPVVLQGLYDAWAAVGDRFASAGMRDKWDKRLDEVATKGWGQMYVDAEKGKKSTDETMRNARRYMKFMQCADGKRYQEMGKNSLEVQETLVNVVLNQLCVSAEKAIERTDYIEKTCVPFLTSPDPPAVDEDWAYVLQKEMFYETRSLSVIAGSWEGQQGCLRLARMESEKIMIENLFNAWVAYKKVAKGIEDVYISKVKDLKKK
jgi:hypothetical protein